jgi:acyl carrier protein
MQVVAYVALRDETTRTADLRTHLQQKLPNYMMPTAFVLLNALPLTPNGKINRRALPSPTPSEPATGYAPPRTPTEDVLANIWCEVLGRDRVGRDDNFFDLGGHSLLAMQILSRLQDALQVDVPLRALLDVPTVAGLALHLETVRRTGRSISIPAMLAMPRQGKVPMSVAQEHVWHFDQLLPGTPFFTLFSAIRLTGVLHVAVLEQSVNEIIRRHEVLRTTFASVNGEPVQVIAPSLHVPLTTADLRDLRPTEREAEAHRLTSIEVLQPFDLAQGPLIRVLLLQLAARERILIVTMSHIISDGWSVGLLVHELALLYHAFSRGSSSPLPALPVQYADFARWQQELRFTDAGAAQLDYWKQQLCHPLPVLELPSDRPRTATLSFRTARQALRLPRALSDALTRLGHREGSTLFMTLVAAFKILLYGYTGQEDLRLGTLLANRHRPEVEGLIGLFVNTVLLRTDLSGNPTLRQVLQRVRATTLAAHAHQHLPFEEADVDAGQPRGPFPCLFRRGAFEPAVHERSSVRRDRHVVSFRVSGAISQ